MEQNKVDIFILNKNNLFPQALIPYIREELLRMEDEKWQDISTLQFKNPAISLLLSIGCGTYGADRFYLGDTLFGCMKLILTLIFVIVVFVQSFQSIEDWMFIVFMLAIMFIVVFHRYFLSNKNN